jgi:hypothetical protein
MVDLRNMLLFTPQVVMASVTLIHPEETFTVPLLQLKEFRGIVGGDSGL